MVKSRNIMKQINQTYFDLLTDAPWYTYERTVQQVVSQIVHLTDMPYASIVIQKNWNNMHGLIIEEYSSNTTEEFRQNCTNQLKGFMDRMNVEMAEELIEKMYAFDLNSQKKKQGIIHMIPLKISDITRGYLMCIHEKDQYTKEFIDELKRNTEQLLKTTQWISDNREKNDKNEFLFNLTSELYTSTNQTYILQETISALEFIYPDFTYMLLLSQDHDADESLPIQMIEYSDNSTKRVSSDVFISGKSRLEKGEQGEWYLYTPLKGKQGVYGVLQIRVDNGVQLPEQEIQFIILFSNVIGEALENAMLYANSKHLAADLKYINEVTHKLNSNLKLPEIISVLKKQITHICEPTHIGFVYFPNEQYDTDKEIDILQGSHPYFHTKKGKSFVEHTKDLTLEQKSSLFKADCQSEITHLPFRSMMALPMFHADKMLGLIIIGHEQESAFTFGSYKLMRSLVQNTTLALTNSVLKNKLEQAVITDYLTKLYSRSYLDENIALHMKMDTHGALVLFDIDDFKHVNDSHGHHIGDQVIVQIAGILKENTRKNDIAARWGGEELALYLPHTSIDEGVRLARRIRKKVENSTNPQVTLSSGVSSWSVMTNHNVKTLFIEADKSLYQAKEQGKNQVVYNV